MIRRYLNTLSIFWSASVGAEMEYRVNFLISLFNSAVTLAGGVFLLLVFYGSGYKMGGWSWPAALAVMGVYTLLDGFQQMLLAPNRTRITQMVRDGTLDFVLLKPIDAQFWLSLRQLSLWGAPNLVLGAAMVLYAGSSMPGGLTLGNVAPAVVGIVLGMAILYAMGYILSSLTIWFVKMENITFMMAALLEAGRYPVPAYSPLYRVFFTFVLPVAFMTTVPARMLGGGDATTSGGFWLLGSLAVAAGLILISRLFWLWALRHYTSASS